MSVVGIREDIHEDVGKGLGALLVGVVCVWHGLVYLLLLVGIAAAGR